MSASETPVQAAGTTEQKPTWDKDRLLVPWNKADALQEHLRSHGVDCTLCLDPASQEARLELRTELGREAVQAILDQWEG